MATLFQRIGIAGGFVVLLLALVANAWVGYQAVREVDTSFEEMFTAQRVLRRLSILRFALSDAETGQRGFLLSGQEAAYLEPYTESRSLVASTLDSLDKFTRPFPEQARHLPSIRLLSERKLVEMAETIELARAGRRAEALALIESGRGRQIMDSLRAEIDTVEASAMSTRDRLRDTTRRNTRRATQTLLASSGALLLLVGAFAWYLRRMLRQRERVAADIHRANVSLGQALAERESALAHVQAMQGQMVQQEKLAGLGRLTAGVAHELKNPLNFVNNFAQLTDELGAELQTALDQGDADEAKALLPDLRLNTAKVIEHGRRADEIVRTMLVHARGVSGERQSVPLEPVLLQASQQAVGPGDLRSVEIVRRDGETEVEVWGVPSALTRLFLNLIENAVHAVRERAGLPGTPPDYVPTVWLGVERTFDRAGRPVAVVTVDDNGPGIPESALPRIFEPFYTTKAPGQGTGLGLSLAYDIAVGHGGSLVAGHAPGGGARLTATLPLEAPPEAPEAPSAAAEAATNGTLTPRP